MRLKSFSKFGVQDDGIIGPKTIAAVKVMEVNDVLLMLAAERLKFYTSLSTWDRYGKGGQIE